MAVDFPIGRVVPVVLEEEMRQSYLDYAMNVIVDRASGCSRRAQACATAHFVLAL